MNYVEMSLVCQECDEDCDTACKGGACALKRHAKEAAHKELCDAPVR